MTFWRNVLYSPSIYFFKPLIQFRVAWCWNSWDRLDPGLSSCARDEYDTNLLMAVTQTLLIDPSLCWFLIIFLLFLLLEKVFQFQLCFRVSESEGSIEGVKKKVMHVIQVCEKSIVRDTSYIAYFSIPFLILPFWNIFPCVLVDRNHKLFAPSCKGTQIIIDGFFVHLHIWTHSNQWFAHSNSSPPPS